MSAFGSGPSNGQFWYGSTTNFPGFLYKKNVGVGGRRSTKMAPGGNVTCNSSTYLYNKFKPGQGGVGASSIANRRAKNRLATVCGANNKCFPCYPSLGQYSNYTHNPNGFIPCPYIQSVIPVTQCPEKIMSGGIISSNIDLELYRGVTIITDELRIVDFIEQPDFSVFDCLKTIGTNFYIQNNSLTDVVSGFNALTSVGGTFIIQTNSSLTGTSISGFNALSSVGGNFAITNNSSLTSVSGFSAFTSVGIVFAITSNSSLTSVSGFNALSSVGSSFLIQNNAVLMTIPEFNALINVLGSFVISLTSLTSVSGFNALSSVGSTCIIISNTSLTVVSGFVNITTINGDVVIDNNNVSLNLCPATYNAINTAKGVFVFSPIPVTFTTNPC